MSLSRGNAGAGIEAVLFAGRVSGWWPRCHFPKQQAAGGPGVFQGMVGDGVPAGLRLLGGAGEENVLGASQSASG
jgi:hypothetical protein